MKRHDATVPLLPRLHIVTAQAAGCHLEEAALRHRWAGDPLTSALLPENEEIWRHEVVDRNAHERLGFIRDLEPLLGRYRVVEGNILHGDVVLVVPGHENDSEVIETVERARRRGATIVTTRDLVRGIS